MKSFGRKKATKRIKRLEAEVGKLKARFNAQEEEVDLQTETVTDLLDLIEKVKAQVAEVETDVRRLIDDYNDRHLKGLGKFSTALINESEAAVTLHLNEEDYRALLAGDSIVTGGFKVTHVEDQA